MRRRRWLMIMLFFACIFSAEGKHVEAASKQTLYNSPYVTFAPDGKAWTTHAGESDIEVNPNGIVVSTGIQSSLRPLEEGEHYYKKEVNGEVPVGKWVVSSHGKCIHREYPDYDYHGITFGTRICCSTYYSGWLPYCADCGERFGMLVYMSKDAAESIDYLEVRTGGYPQAGDMDYFYRCPFCTNLEQGAPFEHQCTDISYNCYRVVYDRNHGEEAGASGFMPDSFHMYNNATMYNGEEVTPITHLTLNTYQRVGYEFAEWNTKPDGSGVSYRNGGEIITNLSEADYNIDDTWYVDDSGKFDNGTVTLYAQWRRSESTLKIIPDGGKYLGTCEPTIVTQAFGTNYIIDESRIEGPAGYTVTFDANGGKTRDYTTGEEVSSVRATTHFTSWRMGSPFHGQLSKNKYSFRGPGGSTDILYGNYERDSIVLPDCVKEGRSFGGWYYDSAFKKPAGGPGDEITPTKTMTLYAQWVELTLTSVDNYNVNNGKGAVDLSWEQPDGNNKAYKVYRSTNGTTWESVGSATDIGSLCARSRTFGYNGAEWKYTVPYTGIYNIYAFGAQGGRAGSYYGGKGGQTYGHMYLEAGEELALTVGGQDGFNGGGAGSPYGNGGGASTVVSDKKGTLLIAGGGGGATTKTGGEGGAEASLRVDGNPEGEDGSAGGGGGYVGGTAGTDILHKHSDACGVHVHSGDEINGGDCYKKESRGKTCTITRTYYSGTTPWFCTGCGTTRLFATDGVKAVHSSCGSAPVFNSFKTTCPVCGSIGQNYIPDYSTGTHYCTETVYVLDCNLSEGYLCEKTDTTVEVTTGAYGGSNYVAEEWMNQYSSNSGVRTGNGQIRISAGSIGYLEGKKLDGVSAPDCASPDVIKKSSVKKKPKGNGHASVSWEEPSDNGTTYYYKVESYLRGSSTMLCTSNITLNTLTTGMKGYYYIVDNQADTVMAGASDTEENFSFTTQPEVTVPVTEEIQYLHVAAVDKAGNIGGTIHVEIRVRPGEAEDGTDILWYLSTGSVSVEDTENTHPAGTHRWYVKADGSTPFTLMYDAFLEGTASVFYQPNYSIFRTKCEGMEGESILFTQSHAVSDETKISRAESLVYSTKGKPVLMQYPYMVTERSKRNTQLRTIQKFALSNDYHGREVSVYPRIGADYGKEVVYSDETVDKTHGIILIGDEEAPSIIGFDFPEGDVAQLSWETLQLAISAEDALSGVRDFYVEIINVDNHDNITFYPDADGIVHIDLSGDKTILDGDLQMRAVAVDNVGNEAEMIAAVTECSMNAVIERILFPHNPVFQCGESGILTITTYGYADRIVVEFPAGLESGEIYSREFIYTIPSYITEERIQFMVPIDAEEGEYVIKVTAYKNGKEMVRSDPELIVDGTILQELRTRLR